MGHEWIIDVLADLKNYAGKNELTLLTTQLEKTAIVAFAEIEDRLEQPSHIERGDGPGTRHIFNGAGAGSGA